MFLRLLIESFARQKRRKALAGIAILLGATAVTAMLALATSIGDRIHRELAVYGANIVVTPKADTLDVKIAGLDLKPATGGAYLKESDLEKLHGIFWANNITGVSPEFALPSKIELYRDGQWPAEPVEMVGMWFDHHFGTITTGAVQLHPWWKVQGQFPGGYSPSSDTVDVLVGTRLARKYNIAIGDLRAWQLVPAIKVTDLAMKRPFKVAGILTTGDATEDEVIVPLQIFAAGNISRIEISARTRPEDAFARQDPSKLSPAQHDIWYCRPYANSIAYQIQEAIPNSTAQQVRRVEQSEGNVLSRISGLMWLISAAALLAAGFAVSAAMATAILERRAEIGLMRSLGASKSGIALLFYAETALLALVAGTLGYLAGSTLAWWLGARIFPGTSSAPLNWALLPVIIGLALAVAVAGSTPSIRAALRLDPSTILRSDT